MRLLLGNRCRFDVGSQDFGTPENGTDARITLSGAIDAYGLPQEVLSDNGDAFATYHRARLSQTERWLASLGVQSSARFACRARVVGTAVTDPWYCLFPVSWYRSRGLTGVSGHEKLTGGGHEKVRGPEPRKVDTGI